MNLDRSLILSYIEEDNIQRAYFRVRPLLSLDGDVQPEALQLWPNEGGLRIVPDRNEQHTFKVRMRKLGAYCVIDLRNQPADAGKIRTNKNFKPERGEVNQYILYSDTVHELPEHTFFQLIDGKADDYAALSQSVITPLFYIRDDDTLYGPVRKDGNAKPEPAEEAAAVMFDIPCPDGVTRSILCFEEPTANVKLEVNKQDSPVPVMDEPARQDAASEVLQEEKAPAAPEEETAALPIGLPLQILDQQQRHEETLKQLDKPVSEGANLLRQKQTDEFLVMQMPVRNEPLTGTPLVRTPLHVATQQNKNRTQEVVSSQWSVGKYEPPAQNLPAGAAMRTVENPVQNACDALRTAWNTSSAQDQLLDFILSLDGIRLNLEKKLCGNKGITLMQKVLRERLQDLEAERLTALCELDRAHRDVDAYKQELTTAMAARLNRETAHLEAKNTAAQKNLDQLKSEVNALTCQRDGLLAKINELQSQSLPEAFARIAAEAQMTAPINGVPLRMSPVSGQHTDAEQLIERMMKTFDESGYPVDRNTAIAVLVLLAVSPRIGISTSATAALSTLLHNIANAFGWHNGYAHQFAAEQHPMIGARPVDSTPAILATSLPNYTAITGATKLTLSRFLQNLTRNAAYDVSQWPILTLPALPFIPALEPNDATPVSQESLMAFVSRKTVTDAELDTVLSPILAAATPLSGAARKEMYQFISICAGLMEGNLPVAVDWGLMLWIIPSIERGGNHYHAVKALLDEYPLSLVKL